MKYTSVHHHSTFSFLDGFGLPEAHVRRAAELGMGALALTDHGNISGHVKLEQAANAAGIKPIFGCELYTGAVDEDLRKQRKNHLTVLAENQQGYRNLLQVVSRGWAEGFYYEPTVGSGMLREHSEGLVVLSGCLGSLLATSLIGGKNVTEDQASYRRARGIAKAYQRIFGDAYYLEVQAFPELEKSRMVNKGFAELSQELGIPLIATGDVHYTKPSESDMQQVLHNVRGGNRQTLEEQARNWSYDVPLCPPVTDKVMLDRLMGTGLSRRDSSAAMAATEEVAARCNVVLPKLDRLRYPLPPDFGSTRAVWRRWLNEGWKYRSINGKANRKEYVQRLKYEMSIIEEKDFIDYFLVVSDVVRFAKDSGIPVGPARGSAAASLVCYLLRITEVDPLNFPSMVFERFIDLTRQDLPDIDLDFDNERRREIRDYLVSKYGADRVSNIGTFTSYKPKISLDDVARVYRVPKYAVDEVKELLLERSSGDLRASATIEDTVEQFDQVKKIFTKYPDLNRAMELEGQYRGMGVHAAGLVVSNGPIAEVCAVYGRKVRDIYTEVISVDKYDAEYLNVLKIDVLGLTTMSMIRKCLELIGMTLEELYAVPLDDPETLQGFRENDVTGVFQFDGRVMRSVNAEVCPDNFKEVADINALARPGPLHSNATAEYIEVKKGRKPAVRYHPLLDAITEDTQYQIVYQEQILRVVREIGGFDWTHAAYIRKIISRKIGEQEFNRQWDRFWKGAKANGLDKPTARTIWDMCITAGTYAFCLTGDARIWKGCRNDVSGSHGRLDDLWEAYNSKTALGDKLRYGQNGKRITLQQMDDDGQIRPRQFLSIERSPIKQPVYRILLKNGNTFKCSLAHRVLTANGYKDLTELVVGDEVVCVDQEYEYRQETKKREGPYKKNPGHTAEANEHNPSWIDGRTQHLSAAQRAVLIRSENACEHCGETEGSLEFAHILDLNSLGGDYKKYHSENNILRLCNSCHKKFDYKKGDRHKRDTVGRPTVMSPVVSITPLKTKEYVYMVEMNCQNHNFIANNVVHHNNLAHSVSYGMLAWWTMWLKRHYPQEFYAAALDSYDKKQLELLRDAARHDLEILPPEVGLSGLSWQPEGMTGNALRAGIMQIPGVGRKTAENILAWRADKGPLDIGGWYDLTAIKGIGSKTVEKMVEFVGADDPFGVYFLTNQLKRIKAEIRSGKLGRLPYPTHTTLQVPYSRGRDTAVTWLGTVTHRNLRELFELHYSKTGEKLDPKEVRDPDLNEWVVMWAEDDEEALTLTVDRWKYSRFKEAIWGMKPGYDLVLVQGVKKGYQSRRAIYIEKLWVIEPEDGGDSEE